MEPKGRFSRSRKRRIVDADGRYEFSISSGEIRAAIYWRADLEWWNERIRSLREHLEKNLAPGESTVVKLPY